MFQTAKNLEEKSLCSGGKKGSNRTSAVGSFEQLVKISRTQVQHLVRSQWDSSGEESFLLVLYHIQGQILVAGVGLVVGFFLWWQSDAWIRHPSSDQEH